MKRYATFIGTIVALGAAAPAYPAALYLGRDSTINAAWLYGGGEDSFGSGASSGSVSAFGDPLVSLSGGFNEAGETVHETPWGVSISYSASQSLTPVMSGAYLQSIIASGSSAVSTVVSGEGLADLNIHEPGNQLVVTFSIDAPTAYTLTGTLQSTDGFDQAPGVKKRDSRFNIDRFNEQTQDYQTIFSRDSQTDGFESLNVPNGSLIAGQYRIVAISTARAFATESNTSDWSFNMQFATPPVPEPSQWLLMLAGVSMLGWYGGRRNRG